MPAVPVTASAPVTTGWSAVPGRPSGATRAGVRGRVGVLSGGDLGTQHCLDPVAGAGQQLLADPGQLLAALPQPDGLVQAQPADLERLDHFDELVARLLVAECAAAGWVAPEVTLEVTALA